MLQHTHSREWGLGWPGGQHTDPHGYVTRNPPERGPNRPEVGPIDSERRDESPGILLFKKYQETVEFSWSVNFVGAWLGILSSRTRRGPTGP